MTGLAHRSRRGSISLFCCLILTAFSLVLSSWVSAAHMRAWEARLADALKSQCQVVLAAYDPALFTSFGLLGFETQAANGQVVSTLMAGCPGWQGPWLTVDAPLSDPLVLDQQMVRQMKNRLPLHWLDQIQKELDPASFLTDALSGPVASLAGSVEAGQVSQVLDTLLGSLLDELADDQLTGVKNRLDGLGLSLLGCRDSDLMTSLFGGLPTVLDPQGLNRLAAACNRLFSQAATGLYEDLCVAEYALAYCTQRVTVCGQTGRTLRTPDGRSMTALAVSRPCELEQVLTGFFDPQAAAFVVRTCLVSLRTLIHLAALVSDADEMLTIQGLAESLAGAVALVSAGTVALEPQAIAYVLVVAKALSAAYKDTTRLLAGERIRLWPGIGDLSATCSYQDHLRLFTLMLPRSLVVRRCGLIIEGVCGGPFYTQVTAASTLAGQGYQLSGGYT